MKPDPFRALEDTSDTILTQVKLTKRLGQAEQDAHKLVELPNKMDDCSGLRLVKVNLEYLKKGFDIPQ